MKSLLFTIALAMSSAAIAQETPPAPDAPPPALMEEPMPPPPAPSATTPDPMATPAPPPPAGQAKVFQQPPSVNQAFPPPPPKEEYPRCSRTVTDSCQQPGGR